MGFTPSKYKPYLLPKLFCCKSLENQENKPWFTIFSQRYDKTRFDKYFKQLWHMWQMTF